MALSLSNDLSCGMGGKAFRFYTITHDGTILVASAHLFDLKQIDWAGNMGSVYGSDIASALNDVVLSITAGGTVLDMSSTATVKAGAKTRIMLIGW